MINTKLWQGGKYIVTFTKFKIRDPPCLASLRAANFPRLEQSARRWHDQCCKESNKKDGVYMDNC